VPLFVAAVLPTQARSLVCRFTGMVMDMEACCPSGREDRVETHAQLLDETCCVLKTVDLQTVVSERRYDSAQPRDQELLAATPVIQEFELSGHPAQIHQIEPPPFGPPILLLKRSFLI
jgi:hypothetical protein